MPTGPLHLVAKPTPTPVPRSANEPEPVNDRCANCGTPVADTFCSACGQKKGDLIVSVWQLLAEFFGELFSFDSKVWRTLKALFTKPGLLTAEFSAGRRANYTSPVKLYLLTSIFFFLMPWSLVVKPEPPVVGDEVPAEKREKLARDFAETQAKMDEAVKKLESERAMSAPLAKGFTSVVKRFQERKLEDSPTRKKREEQLGTWLEAELADKAPKAMFLFLPLFALLLKLFYRKRAFIEHTVFALHFHAFAFLLNTVIPPFWGWLEGLALFATALYLAIAMRRFYGEGWAWTLTKYVVLFGVYGSLITTGVVGVAIYGYLYA